MKLMVRFKQQLDQLGDIQRVWMTSFNTSLDFVETHLLPAVLGMDPPRNRMDYETFQLALTDRNIDFRVFCDKRMLRADQYKRTAIHIQPVSVREVGPFPGLDLRRSLFHPKVIYLEDVEGNMILGAGSANLTVSGWGRNQEVVDFRSVSNDQQYQQIKRFFSGIGAKGDLPVRRKFFGEDHDWEFAHSFGQNTLLDYLLECGEITQLTVWSPYLAADLPAFIEQLADYFENPDLKVSLVTDRIEGRYIRTPWRESIAKMLNSGQLQFHDNPTKRHECTEMTHAKVWQASGSEGTVIAIGSWNFSAQGSSSFANESSDDVESEPSVRGNWRNIEAGIFHPCTGKPKITGPAYTPSPTDFASETMLDEDDLNVPEQLPFDLAVVFDWQQAQYQIDGTWHDKQIDNQYLLKVPGVPGSLGLEWKPVKRSLNPLILQIEDSEPLLTDHFYSIEKNGETVYQGLIIERGQAFRRTQSFNSLQELLGSYVSGTDPTGNDNLGLRQCLRDKDTPDEEWPELLDKPEVLSISYFRLFYAMQEYRKRLEAVMSMDDLQKWLFTYPGCLQELAEKVRGHLEQTDSPAFNWFLANEVNALYKFALTQYDRYRPLYSSRTPPEHQWQHLRVAPPGLPAGDGRRETYLATISKECGYEE